MTSDQLTIAEAAERTGLTRHTLRYYERDGLMLGVGRAGSGHRRYSERDLGWIELITKLRATGMPIREVRRYAELARAGDGNEDERLGLLPGQAFPRGVEAGGRGDRPGPDLRRNDGLVTETAAGPPPAEQRLTLAGLHAGGSRAPEVKPAGQRRRHRHSRKAGTGAGGSTKRSASSPAPSRAFRRGAPRSAAARRRSTAHTSRRTRHISPAPAPPAHADRGC